jgi:Holliday junction resolvase
MPKESLLWKQLRVNSTGIHWQRIESGATASGIPDVNGCFEGREIWVELKVVRGNQIGLRPMQRAWLYTRASHGGECYVLAKKNKTIKVFKIPADIKHIEALTWNSEAEYTTDAPFNWPKVLAAMGFFTGILFNPGF